MTFNKKYFAAAISIFLILVCIALYGTGFLRTFLGDILVVVLLYCLLKSVVRISCLWAGLAVVLFAFSIEITQYFDLVLVLGLENNRIASVVIGRYFDWFDLLAYMLGGYVTYFGDKWLGSK